MARRRIFRDILPKGLYWRTLLIILLPAALIQLVITVVFLDDHWRLTSKRMSQAVAADVALLIQLYEREPTPQTLDDIMALARRPLRLDLQFLPGAPLERRRCFPIRGAIDRYMDSALEDDLGRPIFYDASCPGRLVEIRVPVEGGVFRVLAFRDRVQAESGPLFLIWVLGATLFLCAVTIVFIRNQVRPIETLATAMQRFGRGEDVALFKARGAREVRQATHAFFDMRARIKKHIDQRAQLLAGVSHDLRTPITRLRLAFALMSPSPELDEARRDLDDMEATLEEYLAFARGQWAEEAASADLVALAQEVASRAAGAGARIAFEAAGPIWAPVRALAVKRALANLVDNAAAHGDHVRVEVRREAKAVAISVEDDGPGIPEEHYEEAFRPFSRLDETRTRNAKGVGLGLAIARDVARAHGGDVALSPSSMGGLKATMRIATPA